MPGPLHEGAPKPDGNVNESERRAQLVARFDTTIRTAVKQMATHPSDTMGSFRIKGLDLRYRGHVRDGAGASFEVSQGLRTDEPQVSLETNFRPLYLKRGKVEEAGILRSSVLDDETDKSRRIVGQRILTLEEVEQLVDAMASPPLYVSTLEELIKATDGDQRFIDTALASRDRAVEAYHSRR